MEVKVRVECPECSGAGRKVVDETTETHVHGRVITCDHCAGTGKREEWRSVETVVHAVTKARY